MLNWLTGKDKLADFDHPLGSDAAIGEIIAGLNPGRFEANLIELSDLIDDAESMSSSMPPEGVLRAVMRLDETAQKYVPLVWKQFLGNNALDHIGEQKLKALDTYYRATFAGNRHALRVLIQKPAAGGKTASDTASRLASRALRAHVARARIMHLRYRAPDLGWWESQAEALALSLQSGTLNLKQRAYADDPAPTSPWIEHLLGLFFETAPLGNCNPRQMDLLFNILRWLEPHFMVRDAFGPQATFFTRLDAKSNPRKAVGPLPPDPSNIYFGAGMAYGHLVRLRASIKSTGALPEWMRESQCADDQALAVIDALIMHWSERPPQRIAARETRAAKVRAVNGFSHMRRMIAFSDFARSGRKVGYKSHFEMLKFERRGFADVSAGTSGPSDEDRWADASPLETIEILETAGDKQMMDDWQMQDVSDTGLGAVAMTLKPWMVIGAYVGYRLTDEVNWRIGILRRIHRKESGHPSLGIEVFPESALCAQVSALSVPPGSTPQYELSKGARGKDNEDAIVISQANGHLLAPPGLFAANQHLILSVGGHHEVVRMHALIHSNADCQCIEYEVLED